MRLFLYQLIIFMSAVTFMPTTCGAEEEIMANDLIMWIGADSTDTVENFKSKKRTKSESEKYLKDGLSEVTRTALDITDSEKSAISCYLLSKYYYEDNIKKSLYWAEKGALLGEGDCMLILCHAYYTSNGVVEDVVEAYKWFILAAAMGNSDVKAIVQSSEFKTSTPYEQGHKRAIEWMQQHKKTFFSAN
jgi:TPR repeat protein